MLNKQLSFHEVEKTNQIIFEGRSCFVIAKTFLPSRINSIKQNSICYAC